MQNNEDLDTALVKINGNNITLLVDSNLFYLIVSNKIISKIDKETELIMALLAYIGLYYLLDCNYPFQYEVELTVLHYIFYDSSIPVDIIAHFNKSLEQFNKYKFSRKN